MVKAYLFTARKNYRCYVCKETIPERWGYLRVNRCWGNGSAKHTIHINCHEDFVGMVTVDGWDMKNLMVDGSP